MYICLHVGIHTWVLIKCIMRLSTADFSVHKLGNISQNNPANCQQTREPVKVLKIEFLKILDILKIIRIIRTKNPDTDRTNGYPDRKSGPRTVPKKSGPHYLDHGSDQKYPDHGPDRTITDRGPGNHNYKWSLHKNFEVRRQLRRRVFHSLKLYIGQSTLQNDFFQNFLFHLVER